MKGLTRLLSGACTVTPGTEYPGRTEKWISRSHAGTRPAALLRHLPAGPDLTVHLFGTGRETVPEVVLRLPEPALLLMVPDEGADKDRAGHRDGDDHRECHAGMDSK